MTHLPNQRHNHQNRLLLHFVLAFSTKNTGKMKKRTFRSPVMSAKVIATKIPEKMKTETEGKTDPDKRDGVLTF